MATVQVTRDAEATRRKIIEVAFNEFYRHGFQGGSIARIVEESGLTKGALFHYFPTKLALGYAVLDEFVGPLLLQRWLDPLKDTDDPVKAIRKSFKRYIKEDTSSGNYMYGCPLNNYAQEMSPLDKGFGKRINTLYDSWREHFAAALRAGVKNKSVKKDISATDTATLIVSAQMGIWGTGKSSQSAERMQQAGDALCAYLDTLRA